ncbi:MAG: ATP-binding protein, partial [Acidimicrobiales bacterium]|nr:ATP-binding protein [Acidimicrobiales bacterium]
MGEVQLEIPARPEYLTLARQVVAAAAALEPTFADERIDDLRIAVSEAATNAIEA